MVNYRPSEVQHALLVFVDVVESSRLSAYLGPLDYAKLLLTFQKLFEILGEKYFPAIKDESLEYRSISARGDEGTLFLVSPDIPKEDMIYKALEFIFELKGRLRMISSEQQDKDRPAKDIDLGAGIHYGPVALLTKIGKDDKNRTRSLIERIEGYSINYAKRVETCSRQGNHSGVFFSKEAAIILEGDPIVFSKSVASLKGIGEKVEVFEVQSGYFHDIPISTELPEDESFIVYLNDLAENPDRIDEPWLKPLIISVLDSRIKNTRDPYQKKEYQSRLINIAWHSPNEHDPILLFIRARDYDRENKQTARINYLKKIVDQFPDFIHARKWLVDACWKIAQQKDDRLEKIFARDTANEFIEKFPNYLSEKEKKEFKKILKATPNKN